MSYKISRYGWLPDLPHYRDHFYATPVEWRGGSTQFYAGWSDENLTSDCWTIRMVQ